MSVRHKICHAIAKLPEYASLEEVSRQLDGFILADTSNDDDHINDVTPLMVACDNGQAACLEYMLQNPDPNLWGRADDHSSQQNASNTALHHAAASGCIEAIDALGAMGSLLGNLVKQTNQHGDTPIMMACTYNRVGFLKKLKEKLGDDKFAEALNVRNASDDTPLSLAFGHGHTQVVTLLLVSGVEVSYEAVQNCKNMLSQMHTNLQKAGVASAKVIEDRTFNVKRCLVMLEVALAQKVRDSMDQLIQAETQEEEHRNKLKRPSKTGRKPDSKNGQNNQLEHSIELPTKAWANQERGCPPFEIVTQPKFRTLPDGSVVKNVPGVESLDVMIERPISIELPQAATSVDEMLRQLLREPKNHNTSIDAMMDSLCLDASMLLLSPHGMAMNLSPSQLETIDSILRQQIKSVQGAKEIQARLLKGDVGHD
jgi:Ankyrin repeats (3 copies)